MRPERHVKLSPARRGEIRMRVAEPPSPQPLYGAVFAGCSNLCYSEYFLPELPHAATTLHIVVVQVTAQTHRYDNPSCLLTDSRVIWLRVVQ
jgi:hypothetical protein